MRQFIIRILLLSLPFDIIILLYLIIDPFKAVWHYNQYYSPSDYLTINRGYASTCIYDNNNKEQHYNSFIFGNSRSLSYTVAEWKKYIPQNSRCFHFDCAWGNVEDLYYKVKYIQDQGDTLKNALFVIDSQLLSSTSLRSHVFATAPQLKGYSNYIEFQFDNLKAFTDPVFLYAITDYKINHRFRDYMEHYFLRYNCKIDPITNEVTRIRQDSLIEANKYYTSEYIKIFEDVQYPDSISPISLNKERESLLEACYELLKKNKTNYKIIISPLYDQIKLNPSDLAFLKNTFGDENVYDFSGANKWNLDYRNYYETSHYRPCVANDVLDMIYQNSRN